MTNPLQTNRLKTENDITQVWTEIPWQIFWKYSITHFLIKILSLYSIMLSNKQYI